MENNTTETVTSSSPDPCAGVLATHFAEVLRQFQQQMTTQINRLLGCIYTCWQHRFVRWAQMAYATRPGYDHHVMERNATDAFVEAIDIFQQKATGGKLTDRGAILQTVVWTFCQNSLNNHLRKAAVQTRYFKPLDTEQYDNHPGSTPNEPTDEQEKLHKALRQMNPKCRQLIEWRHLEGRSIDEIAAAENINKASVSNKLSKCMNELRALIEKL